MKNIYTQFLLIFLLISTSNLFSQILFDENFGVKGKVITSFGSANSKITSLDIQKDEKIIACGSYYDGILNHTMLSRYNLDGSLDTSFGVNGKVTTPLNLNNENQRCIVRVLNNGKIIVGGNSDSDNHKITIIRYNSDGILDLDFGNNGILEYVFNDSIQLSTLEIQNDNKIIIGGTITIYALGMSGNPNLNFAVMRYNYDGSDDTSFGQDGFVSFNIGSTSNNLFKSEDYLRSLKIQSDGKIIASGLTFVSSTEGNGDFGMIRLNLDGSLDNNFGINGRVITDFGETEEANSIQILSDGKIILSGIYYYNDDENEKVVIAKYDSDGSLDTEYGNEGKIIEDFGNPSPIAFAFSSEIQKDGKLLVIGYINNTLDGIFVSSGIFILRYNIDGSLDVASNPEGYLFINALETHVLAVLPILQQDGKIVLGGTSYNELNTDFGLLRLNYEKLTNKEFETNSAINVYPNPFNDFLTIDFNQRQCKNITIELYELSGKKIINKMTFDSDNNSVQLHFAQDLPKGVYFLKMTDASNVSVVKIVK